MPTEVDILASAITLIERGWTQRAPARREDRSTCGPADAGAVAWCITGAIYRREPNADFVPYFRAERLVRAALGFDQDPKKVDSITAWNDHVFRTTDDVLNVLRTAHAAAVEAAQAMSLARYRQLFVPNDPRLLPIIGWRDALGAFAPDDKTAVVDVNDGIFMDVEASEDTPTIPPPRAPEGESPE